MASLIFGARLSNADTTLFRAWGSAVSTALGTVLTRVPQTGDIDWATVTVPTASSFAGSEVYRLNDSLHSTAPLFFKFEYGSGSSASPVLRLTIGKSADGSGNIGSVLQSAITVFSYNGTLPTSASNCYISNGDGSGFVFSLQPDLDNRAGGFCCVERSRNSSGQATSDAAMLSFQVFNISGAHNNRFIAYNLGTTLAADGAGLFACPLALSTDIGVTNGTVAQFFPVACIAPNGATWRSRMLLGAARQNASLGQPAESILYGQNYIGLGSGVQRADQRGGAFATYMIWWNP